jgi:hypothetical protein
VQISAVLGRDESFDGAVAAVGHGDLDDLRIGKYLAHCASDRMRGLSCRESAFEGIRRDDDFHL